MTVKEVLQSLVDDNMVDCERIGTSNYYWAFPSKALHARKHKLEELKKQVTDGFCVAAHCQQQQVTFSDNLFIINDFKLRNSVTEHFKTLNVS